MTDRHNMDLYREFLSHADGLVEFEMQPHHYARLSEHEKKQLEKLCTVTIRERTKND